MAFRIKLVSFALMALNSESNESTLKNTNPMSDSDPDDAARTKELEKRS
jgi:hypothetical protein